MHSIFVAVSSTYTFVSTPRTWSDASADCLVHGGTLATVSNAAAQSALMSSIDLSAVGGETSKPEEELELGAEVISYFCFAILDRSWCEDRVRR